MAIPHSALTLPQIDFSMVREDSPMRRLAFAVLLFIPAVSIAQLNSGDGPRFFEAGMTALTGVGPMRDDAAALENLRRAAGVNYAPAQVVMGYLCETGGAGLGADPAQAVEWYKKAAKLNDSIGSWLLGRAYFTGTGTARDMEQAVTELRKSANQGDPFGQQLLGMALLEKGNPAEAAQWFRKAAMQGLPQAQQQLGTLLKQGQGIPADKAEAYVWLALSARAGNSAVSSDVAVLESELGASQAGAAKARVAEVEPGVTRVVVAKGCTGWQGEFSPIPAAPPPDIQSYCR